MYCPVFFSRLPQVVLSLSLSLVTDLRLENAGVEDLYKLLINTLFEVAFILIEKPIYVHESLCFYSTSSQSPRLILFIRWYTVKAEVLHSFCL